MTGPAVIWVAAGAGQLVNARVGQHTPCQHFEIEKFGVHE